jgi:hypothetical protein
MKRVFSFCALLIVLSLSMPVQGQKNDTPALTDSIRKNITIFFTNQGYLDSQKVGSSLDFIYATEMLKGHSLGYEMNGIYRIGVYQSHSAEFVLIKRGDAFKIYDSASVNALLSDVIEFSSFSKLDNSSTFFYLKGVMNIYEANQREQNSQIKKMSVSARIDVR